jgi:glycosyltransferase involved in cell wall biosynthesis
MDDVASNAPSHADRTPPRASSREARPRVVLFTDTLGDVNGVSRFIRNAAETALATGRDFTVVTSTNFEIPNQPNIINVAPVLATKMPKYENLELVLPPALRMMRVASALRPDVIHISTPGSVGLVGLALAKRLRLPIVGVYHTDFPAYIDKLFVNDSLTQGCGGYMRMFYSQFSAIFTRSEDYARSLARLGIARDRLEALRPGIMIDQFHPRFRDMTIHERIPGQRTDNAAQQHTASRPVRFVYCGRVSVEKNMPLLEQVWKAADANLRAKNAHAELVIIGDGPYRAAMQTSLAGTRTRFLGFRYGDQLSALYASCDAFIFPSTTDTLGQVVMESQASGMPVLVSDQGGPKEVVRDGETGWVLPATDPRAWIAAIERLATDHDLRTQMGHAAHEFLQGFSMRASFEHYWSVHERVHAAAK